MMRTDAAGVTADVGAVKTSGATARRRILDRRPLPNARATVGGLLLALSGIVTFTAWQHASGIPERSYVVVRRPVHPGERLAAEDVRLARVDLPGGLAGGAFEDAETVVGLVVLGPIGEGELVQASQVSEVRSTDPVVEVSFAVARDRAVDGHLRSGDRVDVFVTYPEYTTSVAEGIQVVTADGGGSSFADAAQVTVTLALDASARRAELIHAVRAGEVTLVRSTHAGGGAAPAEPGPESFSPDAADAGGS